MAAVDGGIVRPAEWRRVREFAVDIPASPGLLAVLGEAGAGKSTLWRGGVEAAVHSGRRVLRTEPTGSETDLSFAGLSDLLAGGLPAVAADIPAPQLDALEVALLLRAAGERPPTAHAVGLAVLAALRALAARCPVLVAVDDAQWLDGASLDALVYALRRIAEGPVSVLVAARTQASADPLTAGEPPPPHAWRSLLAAVPTAAVLDLAPLDTWQIRNLLPDYVTAGQARMVAQQSRGNPFWAIQIAADLYSGPQGALPSTPVPPLARTLSDRLSRSLSAEAAQALAMVAAAGRITVPQALAVLDNLNDPAEALDAAVLAGVVEETSGRMAAVHPLIGAAAVASLPPGRRAQIYRRLAETATGPERRAHFAALAAGPGADPAVAEALDAAAAAAHGRAANAAAAQFALGAVQFTGASEADLLVRRRIRAAELLFLAGDVVRCMSELELLDVDRLATPDLERALPLLLDMADVVQGSAAAAAIVRHAVDVVGAEPRRRALVLALASDVVYGLHGGQRAAAVEAISCAERAGRPANPSLHGALLNLAAAKAAAAEGLDVGLIDRAAKLERELPTLRLHESADLCRGVWSRYTDDLDTARVALRRCIGRARDTGDDYALSIFLCYLATAEELGGDYAAARTALEAADAAAAWHDWQPSAFHLEPRCELLIASGNLDGAVRLADERLADDQAVPLASRFIGARVRGKVSTWRGDPADAVRHLEGAAKYADLADWRDPGVRYRLDPDLAEAYVAVRRLDEARRLSAWLRDLGGQLGRPALVGDASRIDALLAATVGDLDVAAESAHAAVAAHGASPLRPELARSLLVLGRIQRRRRARKQSRDTLGQALQLATGIGHRPLLAEIGRELARVAAVRSGTELTATERRVAKLITEGATNREAAAALFVSVRTVETHVASIYRKLGVRNRAELARRLSGPAGS